MAPVEPERLRFGGGAKQYGHAVNLDRHRLSARERLEVDPRAVAVFGPNRRAVWMPLSELAVRADSLELRPLPTFGQELTEKQAAVWELSRRGMSLRQIALALRLARSTVRDHLEIARRKGQAPR